MKNLYFSKPFNVIRPHRLVWQEANPAEDIKSPPSAAEKAFEDLDNEAVRQTGSAAINRLSAQIAETPLPQEVTDKTKELMSALSPVQYKQIAENLFLPRLAQKIAAIAEEVGDLGLSREVGLDGFQEPLKTTLIKALVMPKKKEWLATAYAIKDFGDERLMSSYVGNCRIKLVREFQKNKDLLACLEPVPGRPGSSKKRQGPEFAEDGN